MIKVSTVVFTNMVEIDTLLKKQFNKQLYFPKADDQYRLLTLKVWSEKYKVSIAYILSVLLPYFEKLSHKHSMRPRLKTSRGLGVSIPVLVGNAAEEKLLEYISKDYPDGEHLLAWKESRKTECLSKIAEDEGHRKKKPKGLLQYPSVAAYRKAYMARIADARDSQQKQIKELSKQPWRGNPFR